MSLLFIKIQLKQHRFYTKDFLNCHLNVRNLDEDMSSSLTKFYKNFIVTKLEENITFNKYKKPFLCKYVNKNDI